MEKRVNRLKQATIVSTSRYMTGAVRSKEPQSQTQAAGCLNMVCFLRIVKEWVPAELLELQLDVGVWSHWNAGGRHGRM